MEPTTLLLSPEMRAFAGLAAACVHPVLLYGETGVGKTCLAKEIHQSGPRAGGPFVRVNCPAIPDTLFEREMFGHVRGAFTDAREEGIGFFQVADKGVLFLDEVGEIPLVVQPKLLSVLEEGTFRKLGSPREVKVDVRIIAATNYDLSQRVRQNLFRQDLYYRFSVLQYRIPPLRERRAEIPGIVEHLLGSVPGVPEIAPAVLDLMLAYPWPGNIRELKNALAAAGVFAGGAPILPQHLPRDIRVWRGSSAARKGTLSAGGDTARYTAPDDPLREVREIREALRATGGNKTAAAQQLGMSRSTLWIKLQRYAALLDGLADGAEEGASDPRPRVD